MRYYILALALGVAACTDAPDTASDSAPAATTTPVESSGDINFISNEAYRKNNYPFSIAVETDGLIFLSGALGTGPDLALAPGGIGPETRQTMENIKATLAAQGLGMDRIVKCTAMLADMAEWPAFNNVYAEFFDGNYPARSAFGTNGLALGARIEIECIARR